MPENVLYYNDLDFDTIYGDAAVGTPVHKEIQETNYAQQRKMHMLLFYGTVIKINNVGRCVDIQHGSIKSNKGIQRRVYRGCRVMGGAGADENGVYWGFTQLPKMGSEVICGFINGAEEQPIVLGGIITEEMDAAMSECSSENVDKNGYYRNKDLKIRKKDDGTYKIENANASVEILPNGTINILGAVAINLGDNIAKQLCNNFPNCVFSGAPHAFGNTKVNV